MSHAYPLAASLEEALKPGAAAARTRGDAEAMCRNMAADLKVDMLMTDWMTVTAEEADRLMGLRDEDGAHGHLQRYEDDKGAPVVAVSWWKLVPVKAAKTAAVPKPKKNPKKKKAEPAPVPVPEPDHTDDLYFRSGRTKTKRGKKAVDPNQLDMFAPPESE